MVCGYGWHLHEFMEIRKIGRVGILGDRLEDHPSSYLGSNQASGIHLASRTCPDFWNRRNQVGLTLHRNEERPQRMLFYNRIPD